MTAPQLLRFEHKESPRKKRFTRPSLPHKERLRRQAAIAAEIQAAGGIPELLAPGTALESPFPEKRVEVPLYSISKEQVGSVSLNPEVFGETVRRDLIHRIVCWERAAMRTGTHKTKTKAEVSGPNKKPYQQKKTGRARTGSFRNPHMRKGGVAHGPVVRSFEYDLPLKVQMKAFRSTLSGKLQEGALNIIDSAATSSHKTRDLLNAIESWGNPPRVLFVYGENEINSNLALAGRNIQGYNFFSAKEVKVFDILRHDLILVSQQAATEFNERLIPKNPYVFVAPPRFPTIGGYPTYEHPKFGKLGEGSLAEPTESA